MKLAAHEAYELHELILSCVNTITNIGMFLNQVKDKELESIIKKQFKDHIKDYNIKVSFLSNTDDKNEKLGVPELCDNLDSYSKTEVEIEPITPRTDAKKLDDREIATSYLLTLKRAGREYAWSAMEASHPKIRCFLETAFTLASHHAFEVWQWMVKKGYYALEPAPQATIDTFGKMYNKAEMPDE